MTTITISKELNKTISMIKIGKEPVVLVPLKLWQKLEDYMEDREALNSKRFIWKINQARKDIISKKIIYPFR